MGILKGILFFILKNVIAVIIGFVFIILLADAEADSINGKTKHALIAVLFVAVILFIGVVTGQFND